MTQTQWRLKTFMEANRVRPGDLARATEGKLSRAGIYGLLTDERPQNVHFATLDVLLPALAAITGQPVNVGDLIVYEGAVRNPTAKTWRDLAGAFDDPTSPSDMAENHDYYLGEAESEEYDRMTLQGEP